MRSGYGKGGKKDSFFVVAQAPEFRMDLSATSEEDAKKEAQKLANDHNEVMFLYRRHSPGEPNEQINSFSPEK